MSQERETEIPEAQILVIFGASGDLARRKLLPALFRLFQMNRIDHQVMILGVGRTSYDDESWREQVRQWLPEHERREVFLERLHYLSMETSSAQAYVVLQERLDALWNSLDSATHARNAVFYLAVPPQLSVQIQAYLAQQGLHQEEQGSRRLVLEKPFGTDRDSAHALNQNLLEHWSEHQLFRIDHFLGKETVQNLLVFRFANELFDAQWNHRFIDYVEITAAESLGIENRAGYFDQAGMVRDMIQNHLLQLLAMVAMDPPLNFDAQCVRMETMKVFRSLRPLDAKALQDDVVFGQYLSSRVQQQDIAGYRQEPGVPEDSRTETFAALKVYVDHHRWYHVPFYLRTGKRLPTRVTEIVLHFKKTPHPAFGIEGGVEASQNQLVIRIQPDEGILLKVGLKEPGSGFHVKSVNLDFHYRDLKGVYVPESYERLLLDVFLGDSTLFALGDAVEACWEFVDPILQYRNQHAKIWGYSAGSWGPEAADLLMQKDGRQWRYPCKNLTQDGETCEL